MNIPRLDTPKNLRGRARVLDQVQCQQNWIRYCESNEKSYVGPNGHAIRQADYDRLHKLEAKLKEYPQ